MPLSKRCVNTYPRLSYEHRTRSGSRSISYTARHSRIATEARARICHRLRSRNSHFSYDKHNRK